MSKFWFEMFNKALDCLKTLHHQEQVDYLKNLV